MSSMVMNTNSINLTMAVGSQESSLSDLLPPVHGLFDILFDEVSWIIFGFLAIQVLLRANLLPKVEFLSKLSPPRSRVSARAGKLQSHTKPGETSPDHLALWKDAQRRNEAVSLNALKPCAQALLGCNSKTALNQLTTHLSKHAESYPQPAAALNAVVEGVVSTDGPEAALSLVQNVENSVSKVQRNGKTVELLIEAFASKGDKDQVLSMLGGSTEARHFAVAIRGFLRASDLYSASAVLVCTAQRKIAVGPRAAGELLRAAQAKGWDELLRVLGLISDYEVEAPVEILAKFLNECQSPGDAALLRALEDISLRQPGHHYCLYEPLLKIHAKKRTTRAVELFLMMTSNGLFASEGLCGKLLALSGESENFAFVEAIMKYLREREMLSLSIFKTLMKVYASAGKYEEACDLHDDVLEAGFEPDQVMYGCLVKFAVKCNRSELSRKLARDSKSTDVQNHIWLIRSAGQEGDVDRAIQALRESKADAAIYNATMDVCVSKNRFQEAEMLLKEAKELGFANLISYNTLLKGYCAASDIAKARRTLKQMAEAGISADSASYNCLLGVAISAGNFADVWSLLDEMIKKSIKPDHYTVSIVMKVAKRSHSQQDAAKAFELLDALHGLKVCEDDILFNTVLDALIARQDYHRLGRLLNEYRSSRTTKTSVHTYGLLIKAYSLLRQTEPITQLWREMVETRQVVPNTITLSCYLDALVSSKQVGKATAVFQEWKGRVATNTILYATLIKGFATVGDAASAMEMYKQLQSEGHQMNLVAYTSLIDAQARGGEMEKATELLATMEKEGCDPNVITFSAIIKGHCMQGNLQAAFAMFEKMLGRGLKADAVLFNTLLDGCVRHSGFELADALLEKMHDCSVKPTNFTTSIEVKMWGKRRQLDQAFAVVRAAAEDRSRRLDAQIGTCLVSACFLNQAPERALGVLPEMRRWLGSSGPDATTYSTLVLGLARQNMGREATEVAMEALSSCNSSQRGSHNNNHRQQQQQHQQYALLSEEALAQLARVMQKQGLLQKELGIRLQSRLEAVGLALPKTGYVKRQQY